MRGPLFGLLLLAWGASADDIILISGEVIEGKIDEQATSTANRAEKDPSKHVLIITIDDKGTRKLIPANEIKYVVAKKTSWEARREAEEWYGKQRPRDTAPSQETLGKQCRARRLDAEAAEHFQRAYDLKKEALSGKVDDHIALASWCRKYGLAALEKEQWRAAFELKKNEIGGMDLAEWCRKAGLMDEALQLADEVLAKDPGNGAAKKLVSEIRESSEFKLRALVSEYEKAGRGWAIKVAIEDNVNRAYLEEWKKKMALLSEYLFEVTEGQFFLAEVTIEDDTSNGKIIVDKGKKDWAGMDEKEARGVLAYCKFSGTPKWEVHCPGRTWENVLCHELFHGIFGLLDEYYQNPQCPCIMRSAPNPQRLCDAKTHIGGGRQVEPCWDTIKKRFRDVVAPNPKWAFTKQGLKGSNKMSSEELDGELKWGTLSLAKPPEARFNLIDN